MANGYSPVQTAHAPEPANKVQAMRSNPLDSPNDTINNPTAIYVRPKLVPREIVVPHHAGSGNVPIVEYIKTDVICDKDLGSWTAKNVAEFIAATDCSESAKIFIEQVCKLIVYYSVLIVEPSWGEV
jgi:phosphoribosylaminoimidazole (AIR) synthetase